MSQTLQIQLDDGTVIDAYVEDDATTEDLLRAAGRTRIAIEEADVEGHGVSDALRVVVYGPDDVEGHAMTLHLPHADAARELQKKLLAAGVVGVIVVGAATTSVWVADNVASQSEPAAPAAAPAPWWVNPAVRDGGGADAVTPSVTTPQAPDWVNPANRDQFHPVMGTSVTSETTPQAPDWVNPINRDGGGADAVAPSVTTPQAPDWVNPINRDGGGADAVAPSVTTPQAPDWVNPINRDGGGADATVTDEPGANPVKGPQRAR